MKKDSQITKESVVAAITNEIKPDDTDNSGRMLPVGVLKFIRAELLAVSEREIPPLPPEWFLYELSQSPNYVSYHAVITNKHVMIQASAWSPRQAVLDAIGKIK